MMNVVLFNPAIFSGWSLLAALDADADEEAVTRTTVEDREAMTTVVRVTDDWDETTLDEGTMSADESTGDGEGEGEAATAAATAEDGCAS